MTIDLRNDHRTAERAGNWIVTLGAIAIVISLFFIPAIHNNSADVSLIAAGASLFSVGALMAAAGIYTKAKALQAAHPTLAESTSPGRRARGGCELCNGDTPVVQCKVHQLHLCPACLSQHYDFRSCVYVPSTRNKTVKAVARAHGA